MALIVNTNVESIEAQVNQQAQGQLQLTVDVAATAGNAALEEIMLLKLVERACTGRELARARAKFGAQSERAQRVEAHAQQVEQTALAIAAEQERFAAPQAAVVEDAYRYQGRVVDEGGFGVAGRVVEARSADGSTLVATTTDAQGNFTLELQVSDEAATAAEATAAADPTSDAAGKVLRDEVDAGDVTFTVAVQDPAGETVVEGARRVVEAGGVDVAELALEQPLEVSFEFDPRVRYRAIAPRTTG